MAANDNNIIWQVSHFSAGLDSVRDAVFQITESAPGDNLSFFCGWLITADILICPDFQSVGRDPNKVFTAYKDGIEYETEYIDGLAAESQKLILLRLKGYSEGHALPIYMRNVTADTPVLIMQYTPNQPGAAFSFGQITEGKVPLLSYVATTLAGSAGAPVIHAGTWEVMGIHLMANLEKFNSGVTMGSILEVLPRTSVWTAIKETHNLIEPAASETSPEAPDPIEFIETFYRAAVSWQFDPTALPEAVRESLNELVINPSADRWVLRTNERQRLFKEAGAALLRKLDALPGSQEHAGQKMIKQVLKGKAELDAIAEEQLPYYFQVVQWLRPILPGLPGAAEIRKRSEQIRLRSRFKQISGEDFEGRLGELRMLAQWYKRKRSGPLVLSGLGGIGKSALLAHFALSLDPQPLLIWLDFDRADLAPDDHRSLADAFYEQAQIQLDTPLELPSSEDTQYTESLARQLSVLVGDLKPLVILDGFEVAQHVEQYHDIWNFFEKLLDEIPEMKIVISGRSEVPGLVLGSTPAVSRKIEGLVKSETRNWLRRHIKLTAIQQSQVVDASKGIPLLLRLIVSFLNKGGNIQDLLGSKRPILIEGYLYQRVLDRVIDSRCKELAKDALVLRKVNLPLISAVLSAHLPVNMTPADAFKSLSREMGLVNEKLNLTSFEVTSDSEDLYLKPEVRNATLALLEESEPERVAEIDRLAMAYYYSTDRTDADNAAEYIYHALRLGRIELAEEAWTSASYYLLRNSVEEIPGQRAKRWLEQKLEAAYQDAKQAQLFWENDSLEKIRSLLSRGHTEYIQEVLDQRPQRSKGSILYIYDAWLLWRDGKAKQALKVCRMALRGSGKDLFEYRKHVFAAFLANETGDRRQADRWLYQIERNGVKINNLEFRGARIRLFSSLKDELRFEKALLRLRHFDDIDNRLSLFTATDFMRRTLKERFLEHGRESNFRLYKSPAPLISMELLTFLNEGTFRMYLIYPPENCTFAEFERLNESWRLDFLRSEAVRKLEDKDKRAILEFAMRVAFRWYLVTRTETFRRITEAIDMRDKSNLAVADLLTFAVYENLYRSLVTDLSYDKYGFDTEIPALVARGLRRAVPLEQSQQDLLQDLIKQDAPSLMEDDLYKELSSINGMRMDIRSIFEQFSNFPLLQYVLYPTPLDLLAKQALGIPDHVSLKIDPSVWRY